MFIPGFFKKRKQNKEAERANAAPEEKMSSLAMSSLLAHMSHNIRTPMNTILGLTEILLENKSLPPSALESLGKIHSSGNMLLDIIGDIIDLSKIETGRLELNLAKYETASLINDTVRLNLKKFENKPIVFKLQVDENVPSALCGDEHRIKKILNNLLSNAVQYTERGRVTLSLSAEWGGSDKEVTLVIKVQYTGKGMNEDQKGRFFDKHTPPVMDTNHPAEGADMGMSVTWNFIKVMKGTISVNSEPEKDTEFIVRLPQGNTGSASLGIETVKNLRHFHQNVKSRIKYSPVIREYMPYGNVLVVDDLENNLFVAQELLKPYGIQIETAGSGFAAIEKIKAGSEYDIIFMDQMMPDMDGIETVSIIRRLGYKHPIAAFTANAASGQADVFLANGFDAFISKPVDLRLLNDILNKLVRDKHSAYKNSA
jgi:CheY-like chemotaxis protein/nitrogen-specific signal transduction histidine kinase